MNVMGAGFANWIRVDGQAWQASLGTKHIVARFAAFVAGRYHQLREIAEGEAGLEEVAEIDSRFGENKERPSNREIDACRDHAIEINLKCRPTP